MPAQPTGTEADAFERDLVAAHIPLDRFLDYVADLCQFDRADLAVYVRTTVRPVSDQAPFDLTILPNGDSRLALGAPNEDEVRTFTLSTQRWADLRASLLA